MGKEDIYQVYKAPEAKLYLSIWKQLIIGHYQGKN